MKKIMFLLVILILFGCKKKEENIVKEGKEEIKIEEKQLTQQDYINNKVDELGEVPIMMYLAFKIKKIVILNI